MNSLFELTNEYMVLLEMVCDPEVDEQILADTLEGLEGELEYKAENYAKVMADMDAEAEGLDKQIKRLQERKNALKSHKETMKKSLENMMRVTGKTKFKTDLFSFGIQKNPASLRSNEDLDINDVPAEYLKFADPEIDKAAVKEAIKKGEEFTWCHMEQTEGLRIR